jgi:hypothetical protein
MAGFTIAELLKFQRAGQSRQRRTQPIVNGEAAPALKDENDRNE